MVFRIGQSKRDWFLETGFLEILPTRHLLFLHNLVFYLCFLIEFVECIHYDRYRERYDQNSAYSTASPYQFTKPCLCNNTIHYITNWTNQINWDSCEESWNKTETNWGYFLLQNIWNKFFIRSVEILVFIRSLEILVFIRSVEILVFISGDEVLVFYPWWRGSSFYQWWRGSSFLSEV